MRGLFNWLDILPMRGIINSSARVVEWQTRKHEGLVPKGLGVQLPPRAPILFKVFSAVYL